ncbi:MAG: hypothetical protein HKO57_05465 [Akkermansiaceae bacterium]|nr:hypothetical protein [Akkermansiaceae bacterium]
MAKDPGGPPAGEGAHGDAVAPSRGSPVSAGTGNPAPGPTALSSAGAALLEAKMARDFANLEVREHPGGRRSVHLGGRFLHMSAVVTGPDGESHIRCFSSHEALRRALNPQTDHAPSTMPPSESGF